MSGPTVSVGRVALRVEGDFWNAYWAPSETSMADAVFIASVRMSLARVPAVKDSFMELARLGLSAAIEASLGTAPTWGEPKSAPESERSGTA